MFKETKSTNDSSQKKNKGAFWVDVDDIFFESSDFQEIMNRNETKQNSKWKTTAIAIDRFSLKIFPTVFFIIMGIYFSVYLSGYVALFYVNIVGYIIINFSTRHFFSFVRMLQSSIKIILIMGIFRYEYPDKYFSSSINMTPEDMDKLLHLIH